MRVYNVLFLCTGNSARSVFGEALMNHPALNHGRFRGFSAGSHPKGEVNPFTLETLQHSQFPTAGLRSKSWDEFAIPGAPQMDFVFTVCDQAAAAARPAWPGTPMIAHWGVPDPVAAAGTELERRYAFRQAFIVLERRLKIFMSLRIDALDRMALQRVANETGADMRATSA